MIDNPTLSLCMIVKNEEKYLSQCLDSIQDIIDEIIIVDTGSTDSTISIARKYTDHVYSYTWDNNFSNARNFSISKAHSDWILILDADECLEVSQKDELLNLIHAGEHDGYLVKIHNYVGQSQTSNIVIHEGFRLIRNLGNYLFVGSIHEQIVTFEEKPIDLAECSIILWHYGYIASVADEKQKRSRNIPLIKQILELDPTNGFYLFNLANEYAAEYNNEEAIKLYYDSLKYSNPQSAYYPNAYYRLASCQIALHQYEAALQTVNIALQTYPKFYDALYLKGVCYELNQKPTLAIEIYLECIQKETAPAYLQIKKGSTTFLAHNALGNLYYKFGDYEKSLSHYTHSLRHDNSQIDILYRIGETIPKLTLNKTEQLHLLLQYFSDTTSTLNVLLLVDILINIDLLDTAKEYLVQIKEEDQTCDYYFLKGKLCYFLYLHRESLDAFYHFFQTYAIGLFRHSLEESLDFVCILSLMMEHSLPVQFLEDFLTQHQENVSYYEDIKELYYYCKDNPNPNPSEKKLNCIRSLTFKLNKIKELKFYHQLTMFEQSIIKNKGE